MYKEISFVTDTATICIFDEEVLKHRLKDDADWWSDPFEEIAELNEGNLIIVGLSYDGIYKTEITSEISDTLKAKVKCKSGSMFIGPGEEISGDEIGPDTVSGGIFLNIEAGTYIVSFLNIGEFQLKVGIKKTIELPINSFLEPLIL